MIQAKVIADSLSPQGHRLTTLEVVMPRYILAEFNTHRVLSKNSASSRAIPFSKMVKKVQENPFIPYAWQKDHKSMQGNEYFTDIDHIEGNKLKWLEAIDKAIGSARWLMAGFPDDEQGNGVTKQLCNRLLEPFMWHKVLVSGTEWENFFNLRCPQYQLIDKEGNYINKFAKSRKEWCNIVNFNNTIIHEVHDYSILDWFKVNKGQADIHMMFLAEAIYDAINESTPKKLEEGEWHIPYGDNMDIDKLTKTIHKTSGSFSITIEEAKRKISVARCARLSYQTLGDNPIINYEKDLELYEVLSKSGHWSPFEHVAKVMEENEYTSYIKGKVYRTFKARGPEGATYQIPSDSEGWCRNFRGFIQQRALID